MTRKEKALARALEWQKNNPERRKEIRAKWIANNFEQMRSIRAEWKRKNADKVRASKAATEATRRAKKLVLGGSFTPVEIDDLLTKQRGCCAICKINLRSVFERDHIVPLALDGANDIGNIQLLCKPCNRNKGYKDPIEYAQKLGKLL